MKRSILNYTLFTILSFCAGFAGAIAFNRLHNGGGPFIKEADPTNARQASYRMDGADGPADFVKATNASKSSVVFIKALSNSTQSNTSIWDPFGFFGNMGPVTSSGSGVVIGQDGYIITNNHVVKDANQIEITLSNSKKTYPAKVVGKDPSTDLALLKIDADNLSPIVFANSDDLQVGQWVVAVGNPFNLNSSVTAGIVSAKGRNINIVQNEFPIESFIQTDAAINPGNSGGALVNPSGELVGINTAILSKTGSYAGYGFAIPSNIVKKVAGDIKEFGHVQRAFVEAQVTEIDEKLADQLNDESASGVYVLSIATDGNADRAGLKSGDVILKIDNRVIDSRAVYEEQLAYYRPGDKITLMVKRGGEAKQIDITLTNEWGNTSTEANKSIHSDVLGADFTAINKIEKEKYNADGIRVTNITGGRIAQMNLPEGYIITSYNNRPYDNPDALIKAMENSRGRIIVQGIQPNGTRNTLTFFSY